MQQAPFRYTLTFKDIQQNAEPLGVDKAKIKYEKPSDCVFFRQKITDKLTFKGEEFKFLHAIEKSGERCEEIGLQIDAYCQGVYTPRFSGYFSLNDVDWNIDKGTAVVAPKSNDVYRPFLENYSKQHNILEVAQTYPVTAKLDAAGTFEFILTGVGATPATDPDTWKLFLQVNYWIDGTVTQRGTRHETDMHFRLVRTEPLVNGEAQDLSASGWAVVSEDGTKAKYAKQPDIYNFKPYKWGAQGDFDNYPSLIQISPNTPFDSTRYIDVTAGFTNGTWNVRTDINDDRYIKVLWEFGAFTFTRNRKILDVVRYLVTKTTEKLDYLPDALNFLPATDQELSEFFTSNTNYATNQPNKLKELYIAQKSDILSYNSSEAATKGMLSLKELTDMLRNCFKVYWFINDLGKFQLEHISYFENTATVDLTAPAFAAYVKGTNAYEYDKGKMPRYERLKFEESDAADFREGVIEYGGVCVNYEEGQDTASISVSRLNNDIEQLLTSSESMSKDGFVLLIKDGTAIAKEAGDATGRLYHNGHLSAANLLKNYHLWDRVLPTGVLNGKLTTFKSVLKTKKQISLSVPACCNTFSPYARYITSVSSKGSLDTMEITLKDGLAKLDILHEVTGDGAAAITRQFDDSFNLSFK